MEASPLAYFLTYHTYGTWLHGRQEGSVDPQHNKYGTPVLPANAQLVARDSRNLRVAPVLLDDLQRGIVDETVRDVANYKDWRLHALNVRTTHVHAVITADLPPERIMNSLKSWATRRMVEKGAIERARKVWSRHGSTRYLWTPEKLAEKIEYVLFHQGPDLPMRYD